MPQPPPSAREVRVRVTPRKSAPIIRRPVRQAQREVAQGDLEQEGIGAAHIRWLINRGDDLELRLHYHETLIEELSARVEALHQQLHDFTAQANDFRRQVQMMKRRMKVWGLFFLVFMVVYIPILWYFKHKH